HVLHHLHEKTGLTDLGLSGGVAYNSVMNGKILLNTPFRRVFVQPAAGDSGTALGVCYEIYSHVAPAAWRKGKSEPPALAGGGTPAAHDPTPSYTPPPANAGGSDLAHPPADAGGSDRMSPLRTAGESGAVATTQTNSLRYVMETAYTGPEFTNAEISAELDASNLQYEVHSDEDVTKSAARDIADGLVVGWFQGRMEFGPRALGNRSIVVDPRRADMKEILNHRIKKREPFRPFAPSILEEYTGEYFEQTHPAPTMLMVYQIRPEKRAIIPAVTHVDGSGRLQTVTRKLNP